MMGADLVFGELQKQGFQVEFHCHASAIFQVDFADAVNELQDALLFSKIPIEEIIASGGGEAKGTQRLRRALTEAKWNKTQFLVEKTINGVKRESQSHIVDHVREHKNGRIALEIEWNNKDPFFDRDLENFKRLHADGAISIGMIVTRGETLQSSLKDFVRRFLQQREITDIDQLSDWDYNPTRKQRESILKRMKRKNNPISFQEAFVDKFVSDKFGEATTHWRKLEDRVQRGVGNPCPLILIGLPASIVSFEENLIEVQRLIAESEANREDQEA